MYYTQKLVLHSLSWANSEAALNANNYTDL